MTEIKTKLCRTCGEVKPLDAFDSSKNRRDGRHHKCKSCKKEYMRDYWQRDDVKAREGERRKTDPKYIKGRRKRTRNYRQRWARADKEKHYAYKREKRKKFPKWRLHESISARMRGSLRRSKAGTSLNIILTEILHYDIDGLRKHLEKHFRPGMTWENYGKEWHVDHIIPVAAFNFETACDIDFKKCWSLKNLQPLWKEENLRKNQRLERPFQPSLAMERCSYEHGKRLVH